MPRELRSELQALIESGHCNWHTAIDIELTSGTELHLSTGEIFIDRFDVEERAYLAKLREVGQLDMSMDIEVDQLQFKVANVDMVAGQLFTGATRQLDGAQGTRGVIFIDRDADFSEGQHILDQNFPGELVAGEVSDETVDFTMPSVIDTVIVSGRTIASEFQWREPVSNVPSLDPSDLPFPTGGGPRDPESGSRLGRYGDDTPIWPVAMV